MFDTHTHLAHRAFRKDREATYERALNAGVNLMLEIGWDIPSSEAAIRFAEEHGNVWAAIGVHPHDSKDVHNTPYLQELEELSRHPKVKAIGEIGLDYYRDLSPRDIQKRVFIEQIELAEDLKLPFVVHCRDAMDDCLPIVAERGYYKGVFHSAAANKDEAKQLTQMGIYLGINGTITYNGKRVKSWIPEIPKELLLIETDCPYLTPIPHRGERNEPAMLQYTAAALTNVLKMTTDELSLLTEQNGRKLFGV